MPGRIGLLLAVCLAFANPAPALTEDERATISLFEKTREGEVSIPTETTTIEPFRMRDIIQPSGTGSGILRGDLGHVLIDDHVIEGARRGDGASGLA